MDGRFHPAAQRVRAIVASGELGRVTHVRAAYTVPRWLAALVFKRDDIRFQYALGGGCMMDVGGARPRPPPLPLR